MATVSSVYDPIMGATSIDPKSIPAELIPKYWAQSIWSAGIKQSYFSKFMGRNSSSIIQIVTDLAKKNGDALTIPLRLPLTGAGRTGDDKLEGFEEALQYRSFSVTLNQLRHAVLIEGRFLEKQVPIQLRKEARESNSDWLAEYLDRAWFSIFTGTEHPFIKTATDKFPFTLEAPSADRIVYPGNITAESAITAGDIFTPQLITKAKLKARENEYRCIRPVKVDGRDTYVMVIDPWQARDLKANPDWIEAQKYANVRGEKNPIFSGSIGIWDGVVIHETERVPRTDTGDGGTIVGHALLLGAQAGVFVEGEAPRYVEKEFDYDNQIGFSISRMCGMKKARFQYDGVDWTDFGVLNVLTASVA